MGFDWTLNEGNVGMLEAIKEFYLACLDMVDGQCGQVLSCGIVGCGLVVLDLFSFHYRWIYADDALMIVVGSENISVFGSLPVQEVSL